MSFEIVREYTEIEDDKAYREYLGELFRFPIRDEKEEEEAVDSPSLWMEEEGIISDISWQEIGTKK